MSSSRPCERGLTIPQETPRQLRLHDAFALSFRATADKGVVLSTAYSMSVLCVLQRLSDCISVIGLVESVVPTRTCVETAPEDLVHSSDCPVFGDQPEHRLDVHPVSQVLFGVV